MHKEIQFSKILKSHICLYHPQDVSRKEPCHVTQRERLQDSFLPIYLLKISLFTANAHLNSFPSTKQTNKKQHSSFSTLILMMFSLLLSLLALCHSTFHLSFHQPNTQQCIKGAQEQSLILALSLIKIYAFRQVIQPFWAPGSSLLKCK